MKLDFRDVDSDGGNWVERWSSRGFERFETTSGEVGADDCLSGVDVIRPLMAGPPSHPLPTSSRRDHSGMKNGPEVGERSIDRRE